MSTVTTEGVASRFDFESDCTALTIAPKIALPAWNAIPPRPPVAPSTEPTAASCRASATPLFWVVVTTWPLTVVVVVRSRSAAMAPATVRMLGDALE